MIRILCAKLIKSIGARIIPQFKNRIFDCNLISCRCKIAHSRIIGPNTLTKTHSCQATGNRKTCERCFGFIRWCSKILFSRCVTSIFFTTACFDLSISIQITRDSAMKYRPCCRPIGWIHCYSSWLPGMHVEWPSKTRSECHWLFSHGSAICHGVDEAESWFANKADSWRALSNLWHAPRQRLGRRKGRHSMCVGADVRIAHSSSALIDKRTILVCWRLVTPGSSNPSIGSMITTTDTVHLKPYLSYQLNVLGIEAGFKHKRPVTHWVQ